MTLKTRILILNIVSLLLVVLSMFFSSKLIQDEVEQRFETTSVEGVRLLWDTILENQMDNMEANSSALARDRETRNALRSGDIETLNESMKTTYNLLSSGKIISGLQIADKQGQVISSAPEGSSVNFKHPLIAKALQKGKIMRGTMILPDGKPVIAVAFPLLIRGKAVGGVAFYLYLDQAVEVLKKRNQSEVVVLNAQNSIMNATDDSLYQKLKLTLPDIKNEHIDISSVEKLTYSTAMQPVYDYQKHVIGRLLTIKDYTESFRT